MSTLNSVLSPTAPTAAPAKGVRHPGGTPGEATGLRALEISVGLDDLLRSHPDLIFIAACFSVR